MFTGYLSFTESFKGKQMYYKFGNNLQSYKILPLDSKIFYNDIVSGGQGCQYNTKIKSSTGSEFLYITKDRSIKGPFK